MSRGPLDGTLVVDLSRALAGPHATMMLGDLGARVIKVEVPGVRRRHPRLGSAVRQPARATRAVRESTYFLSANRNKESVTLDLKADDDKAVLLDLVRRADVLVENFRTGVLDRLGLGFETLQELNPRLVVLSITGFGHDGPEGGRAGYDQIAQGEAGLMSLDRVRTRRPAEGRGADLGPAGRHVRRVRRPRRAARAGAHRRGDRRAHVAAGRDRRGARVPGHPVDRRRGGRPGAGQPPRLDRALRAVPLRRRHRADRAGQREPVATLLRRLRPRPRRPRGWRPTPSGSPTASRPSRSSRRRSRTGRPSRCWPGSPRSASRRARCGTVDEVYAWDQVASQGLLIDGRARDPRAGSRCPVRRCGSSTGTASEVTRDRHDAPPTLDEHGAAVRQWLREPASPSGPGDGR